MKDFNLNDTIAAISTPVGKSGIGIVRLSGQDALSIADKIFTGRNGKSPSQLSGHTLHYGRVGDIDEVLLSVMRAPKTYTREDIVEINCHSGIIVLKRMLELVLKMGARLAKPGEFTQRAYLNGRIDLAQAEAVLDVINAQTKDALAHAIGQLTGRLSRKINDLRLHLLDISAQLELGIDFSDQEIQPQSSEELLKKINIVAEDLKQLLSSAEKGMILREGITCVICGKVNVGKSSLMNALLKRDRAIVTAIPGTTRDVLEETIDLMGIPLRLTDTAGIMRGGDLAEKEAVKRSRDSIKQAGLVLFVLDASKGLSAEDKAICRYIPKNAFIVLNKQDLPQKTQPQQAQRLLPGRKTLSISALRGRGLDELEQEIASHIWQGKSSANADILVTNIRHSQALKRAQQFIQGAIKAMQDGQGAEITALEIKDALGALAEIIGEVSSQDILNRIFGQFCIGK